MVAKKIIISFLVSMCLLLVQNITFGAGIEVLKMEKQEYKQERARIKALEKSFAPGSINDLKKYEKFANGIQSRWKGRNKEYNARLMLEVCGPLSSGSFKDKRCYDIRRKYALSALEEPNEIALVTELELTGYVITDMYTPYGPKGADFARRRRKDVQIRLHAWKRLIDAIDPSWDPNERLFLNVVPPVGIAGEAGMSPKNIKDPVLRSKYEAAIQRNRQKIKRHSEQRTLRKWLKRFPRNAEPYIIQAYSKPPFNLKELKQYLDNYIANKETKARIVGSVTKRILRSKSRADRSK